MSQKKYKNDIKNMWYLICSGKSKLKIKDYDIRKIQPAHSENFR